MTNNLIYKCQKDWDKLNKCLLKLECLLYRERKKNTINNLAKNNNKRLTLNPISTAKKQYMRVLSEYAKKQKQKQKQDSIIE